MYRHGSCRLPPQFKIVTLPKQPSDPPTDVDLAEATYYKNHLYEVYHRDPILKMWAFKDAVDHERKIYASIRGDFVDHQVPPCPNTFVTEFREQLTESMRQITARLRTELTGTIAQITEIKNDLTQTRNQVDDLAQSQNAVYQGSSDAFMQFYKHDLGDGSSVPFETVPLKDGTNPVTNHDLPPLHIAADIGDLNSDDLRSCVQGYGIPVDLSAADNRRCVKAAVRSE